MEIKVNDYVRTKDYQNIRSRIGKIIKQDGKYYYLDIDKNTQMVWEEDTILKSSPRIIDLIDVGDYVNGHKVYYCYCADEDSTGLFIDTEKGREWLDKSSQIKSIVTKEQFENISYKVGE